MQKQNTTLNIEIKINNGSECRAETTALDAKLKLVTMSVRLRKMTLSVVNEKTWWLWTSSWKIMMALNANRRCGSERRTKQNMALNAETNDMQWLWTPNEVKHSSERWNEDVAPNAKWRCGSECRPKMWLWTPNEANRNSECWNEWYAAALNAEWRQVVALNTETKVWLWTSSWKMMVALNTKWSKTRFWTPKRRCGSEHQMK